MRIICRPSFNHASFTASSLRQIPPRPRPHYPHLSPSPAYTIVSSGKQQRQSFAKIFIADIFQLPPSIVFHTHLCHQNKNFCFYSCLWQRFSPLYGPIERYLILNKNSVTVIRINGNRRVFFCAYRQKNGQRLQEESVFHDYFIVLATEFAINNRR